MPPTTSSRWQRRGRVTLVTLGVTVATAGVVGVVAAAFALSFDAIEAVGVAAGMTPELAWLLPVSVDGVMVVAAVVAVLLKLAGRSAWYPWLVTLAGVAVSVACNAAHARPVVSGVATPPLELTPAVARAVSTIPALALALSVHLIIVLAMAVLSPGDTAVTSDATGDDNQRDTPATGDDTVATPDVAASDSHDTTTDPWQYATPARDSVSPSTGDSAPDSDSTSDTAPHSDWADVATGWGSDTDPVDELDRQRRGHAMAQAGATPDDIVAALGVSKRTAQRYAKAVRQTA